MTLTAPGCPVAGEMPGWVENAVSSVPGVGQVKVKLVFDPPWDMSRMTDEARACAEHVLGLERTRDLPQLQAMTTRPAPK